MGRKTNIDWADATWNPVTGCLHGCKYCYAHRIARRFASKTLPDDFMPFIPLDEPDPIYVLDKPYVTVWKGRAKKEPYPYGFEPTFHRYLLHKPKHWKTPRNIFVCSMADLFGDWVPDEWIAEVFKACEAAPQHRYLFLTKNPDRLVKMANAYLIAKWNSAHETPHSETHEFKDVLPLPRHDNWWFGSTLDNANAERFQGGSRWNTFTSIEPLMEHMDMGLGSFGSDRWTIIGAETGTRKNKVIPKREWVENILDAAAITGVKVFMKESLRELMGDDFRQEFPW